MNKYLKLMTLIGTFLIYTSSTNPTVPDATFIGSALYTDGICRIPIGLIDTLRSNLDINFIISGFYDPKNIPLGVREVIERKDRRAGKVAILFDSPWHRWGEPHKSVPDSFIKIAYSMLESDAIPQQWVQIFNEKFDAVVVPDDFLVEVYKRSGVIVPIFVIPIGLYLEDFLKLSTKKEKNKIFTFGCSGVFIDNKNQELLVKSFYKAFKNDPKVQLLLHGRGGNTLPKIRKLIEEYGAKNIKIIAKSLSPSEYLRFMGSLDCYVLISKGEGFSITPREALACGVPCILSHNSAHKTIINSGLVGFVESNIPQDMYYEPQGMYCGKGYNSKESDVQAALLDMLKNYKNYLKKAQYGRIWVKQYLYQNMKNKYATLIKPKKVSLGSENKILDNEIITNSRSLYEKYNHIIAHA